VCCHYVCISDVVETSVFETEPRLLARDVPDVRFARFLILDVASLLPDAGLWSRIFVQNAQVFNMMNFKISHCLNSITV
jgi:hypothetical protein